MAKQKKSDWRKRDPEFRNEARKYEHPVPSRPFILSTLKDCGKPLTFDQLVRELGVAETDVREGLRPRLRAMERDGQIIRNRRDAYCLMAAIPVITGRVSGHRDGFGFLIPDEGDQDIYLAPRQMRELMHGDRAAVRIRGHDRRGRPEGSVVEVLERAHEEVAGRFVSEGGVGFVVPDNTRIQHRIVIPPRATLGARDGQLVVAAIEKPPTAHSDPVGRVAEVLGEPDAPGIETEIAIRSFGLPHEFPPAVLAEADGFGAHVTSAAKRGLEDLRELPLVTIDGADAKDFDDAVYCVPTPGGWRLYVAIAHVSHYVQTGSALDQEARERGTSVYFPNRVIPMLPEALSNGLCSLQPNVDRLCMVCEMLVSREGTVTRARFYEAVMRSAARLTYDEVAAALLEKEPAIRTELGGLLAPLQDLQDLYKAFAKARRRRGAIDFDLPDVRIRFDARGRIAALEPYVRNDAHKLIEECMIAANVQAARFLQKKKIPALYRRHDEPDEDRIASLREFLAELGLKLGGARKLEPEHLSAVVRKAAGRPDAALIDTLALRSMALAIYHPECHGHFGLALEEYAHFTSPIRRYPDLLVHRAIRHALQGGTAADYEYSRSEMEALGRQCSSTERRAEEATREAVDWLRTEFMQDKLGEEFDAIVSGVTDFGIFVQLEGLLVEGLVHVSSLGSDYFLFERDRHRLVGKRSGKVYSLADRIRVRAMRANLEDRRIDFELVEEDGTGVPERDRKRRRRRR